MGKIFVSTDLMSWMRVNGVLDQLIVGDYNGDTFDDLAGLNATGRIYYTADLSSWSRVPGALSFLAE